jgi:hypothetical protein
MAQNRNRFAFTCKLGLAQNFCGKYEFDPDAPEENKRWGGCVSCKHRDIYIPR